MPCRHCGCFIYKKEFCKASWLQKCTASVAEFEGANNPAFALVGTADFAVSVVDTASISEPRSALGYGVGHSKWVYPVLIRELGDQWVVVGHIQVRTYPKRVTLWFP
jgi:hypothetical protein